MVLTRMLDRFLAALDAEGVGLFQAIVYLHVVTAGLYLMIGANGLVPQSVEESLGASFNAWWLWLCLGPMVCLVGKVFCWMRATRYAGMWMQLSGDIFGFGVFLTYVVATIGTSWWGRAVFAVFVCAAIGECVALLILRDIRRIDQVEREVRR